MAVIHVSNINDFVSAVETIGAEVIVDSNIDAQSWIAREIVVLCASISGNGYNISNLQYSANINLFSFSSVCTINNLNFINCLCYNRADYAFFHARNNTVTFNDCQFQGLFYNFAYRRIQFNRCTMAFESGLNYAHWTDTSVGNWNVCYVDFKNQLQNNNFVFAGVQGAQLINCYFQGRLQVGSSSGVISFTPVNCVFNIEFSAVSAINPPLCYFSLDYVSLYNVDKLQNVTFADRANMIGLSDTALKTPAAVIATGFPLIQ